MRRRIIWYNPILKARARRLRNNMTKGEQILWQRLKKKQILGFDFDRQRPINHYIVDFYCKDLMLAIEVDGSIHDSEDAQIRDGIRQSNLEALGVRFLRFRDEQVRDDLDSVVEIIEQWIDEHKGHLVGRIED